LPRPSEPVSPREFFEDLIPSLFAELDLGVEQRALDLKLAVRLDGDEGGAWTLHFIAGELGIVEGRDEDAAITLVQSVSDWRSALWKGRPGLVSDLVAQAERVGQGAGSGGAAPAWAGVGRPVSNPRALDGLRDLKGLIEIVVASEGTSDWRLGIQLGPGPIPEAPQAVIRIGAVEAEAIRRGVLHPLEALIGGQLRLEGDLGLILQLQAIAMTASLPPPPSA
jgi:hypothetical protein